MPQNLTKNKNLLEYEISTAYVSYSEAVSRDLRADGMSKDAKQDMQATMTHIDYLLDEYFESYVQTQFIESD